MTRRLSLLSVAALAAALPVLAAERVAPPPTAPAQAVAPATVAGDTASTARPSAKAAEPTAAPLPPPVAASSASSPHQAAAAPSPPPKPPAPLRFAAVSKDPRPTLDPGTFIHTLRAADHHRRLADEGGWPALPSGTVLKSGDRGPLVAALKRRLALTGDLPPETAAEDTFDAPVLAAVKAFQARHGLPESGVVREKTIAALNVPAETRARQLAMSAQRLVGTRFPFGERYVVVNIPSAVVEAVENGEVKRRYVAVVGKKERATPAIMARITAVNFNPTWTVPVSVVKKDIIPHVRKDPAYLAKMKIRILDGHGQEVDPAAIDWSTEKAADYLLRQDPGAANSLGQVRIDMPNKQAVYMHDTPTKRFFAQDARFHSSGCVRVGDVRDFVGWLMEGTLAPNGPWTPEEIEAAIALGQRQDVKLGRAVPVAWVYLTGYALPDGTVHFRDDVYGLDREQPMPAPAPGDMITSSISRRPS